MPPSTSITAVVLSTSSSSILACLTFLMAFGIKDCPPKPGFTDIIKIMSKSEATSSNKDTGVPGLSATPAFMPHCLICWIKRCICGTVS